MTRTMRLIDACVAAKWFVPEPDSPRALALLSSDDFLCAPDLIVVEVGEVFRIAARDGDGRTEAAASALKRLTGFFDEIIPHGDHAAEAMRMSLELDQPIGSCFYLAIAAARDIPLVTVDMHLVRRLARTPYEALVELL